MKSFIILLSFVITPLLSLAEVYYRPVPTMPILDKPISEISDVITYSLVTQVHKGLFKKEGHQINVTELVKDFEVKEKGRIYTIQLASNLKFNDGTPLTAHKVKSSLENALMSSDGHLTKKFGLGQVIQIASKKNKLTKKWIKLNVLSGGQLQIKLSEPSPKLVSYLADPRMSILTGGKFKVGIGDYKITSVDKNRVRLTATNQNVNSKFKEIIYYKLAQEKAVEEFQRGKVHDLSLYNLSKEQLKKIDKKAQVGRSHFPRTFAFFINSKRLPLNKRKIIANYLSKTNLVKNCKIEGQQNNSLIPKGFPGSTAIPINNIKSSASLKIKVMVPKGLGNEDCIKKSIIATGNSKVRFYVEVNDFSKVAGSWLTNSIDVFYGYIEGESDFSFFEHFLASSTFPLGKKNDLFVVKKYDKILSTTNLQEKHKYSKRLSAYLDNKYYYLPVYSPVVRSAYKANLLINEEKLQAPYQLEIARVK